MLSSTYARGSKAWGLCKRCGLRFLLRELVFDGYMPWLRVCATCYDPPHPQERAIKVSDPQALWRPSPEYGGVAPVLSGTQLGSRNTLTWTEADTRGGARIESYAIYRAEGDAAAVLLETLEVVYSELFYATEVTLTYEDTDIELDVEYTYYVVALNSAGGTLTSNEVSLTQVVELSAPVLSGYFTTDDMDLSWTASVVTGLATLSGYELYRKIGTGSFELLDTLGPAVLTYQDANKSYGTTYYYYVVAISAEGYSSDASNTLTRRLFNGLLTPLSVSSVTTSAYPFELAIHPDGGFLYATLFSSSAIAQFSIANGLLSPLSPATVSLGGPPGQVVVSPDGNFAYAVGVTGSLIYQFAIVDGALVPLSPATVTASSTVRGLAIHPSGLYLYVTSSLLVSQYTIGVDGKIVAASPATIAADLSAQHITVSPDGLNAYVANGNSNTISQFSISGGLLSAMSPATVTSGGNGTSRVICRSDGLFVYAPDSSSGTVQVYSVSAGALTRLSTPYQIASAARGEVSPDGAHAYFASARTQWAISGSTGRLSALSPSSFSGSGNGGMALTPDGLYAYLCDDTTNKIWQYSRS